MVPSTHSAFQQAGQSAFALAGSHAGGEDTGGDEEEKKGRGLRLRQQQQGGSSQVAPAEPQTLAGEQVDSQFIVRSTVFHDSIHVAGITRYQAKRINCFWHQKRVF